MNCPVCPNTSLVMAERQGIEIDYCPSCRGVWLDRGELDKIMSVQLHKKLQFHHRNNNRTSSRHLSSSTATILTKTITSMARATDMVTITKRRNRFLKNSLTNRRHL